MEQRQEPLVWSSSTLVLPPKPPDTRITEISHDETTDINSVGLFFPSDVKDLKINVIQHEIIYKFSAILNI